MRKVAVRDGQVKQLVPVRCDACGRLLMRIDTDALRPGKMCEIKCKCDAYSYRIGESS